MKHAVFGKKLSRNTNERKQLFRNLIKSLVDQGFVTTTHAKVKAIQGYAEKLVTLAKKDDMNTLRRLISETGNIQVSKKLIAWGSLFKTRNGGYTRCFKMGFAQGDNHPITRLEFVEKLVEAETIAPKEKVDKVKKIEKVKSLKEVIKDKKTDKKKIVKK